MSNLTAIILAAGKGTRMKSKLPKVLHKVGGLPMLQHVLDAADAAGCQKKVVIIGHEAELVEKMVGKQAQVVLQAEQLGTGHAVLQAEKALTGIKGTALILCGDTPLLRAEELTKFAEAHIKSGAAATVMTTMMENPFGYGRILRDAKGNVQGIVEQKDATDAQKAIKEINTGIYCVEMPLLFTVLKTLTNNNAQGEYYLTDLLSKLNKENKKVAAYVTPDSDMVMGINSRRQMADAEKVMRERILNDLMDSGVTIMDPASTFIEKTVKIAPDTIIYPYTWLQGTTTIGTDCEIGPNVRFTNVKVGEGNQIQFCYAHDCEVKNATTIGPYVHLRPDTVIDDKVHIGNYVEVKNSTVGKGTKLPHLTYIGDTDIGSGVNMGCGCITVNYDGKVKHRTKIGDNAFVGCNTNLVAPVEVGKNTYIGAGSTITKNVPEDALGIGRARQLNIEGWAKNKLKK
jgi:bifunctional UDP-N-acetylglucosamine pyrophosphorylase/glucosamine-1-phosphate N-acetyltransferase